MQEFIHWMVVGLAFGIGFCVAEAVLRFVAGLLGQARPPRQQGQT